MNEVKQMGKLLVLYHSNTRRTAQMAAFIATGAEEIANIEVRVRSVDEATADDVIWCDGLAVGTPTNLGAVSWKMKKFWDELSADWWGKIDGKIACAFSSSGSYGGGSEMACLNMLSILINYGFLVFGVTEYAGQKLSPHYGAVVAGAPDTEGAKATCALLGRRLAEWVAYYVDQQKQFHPRQK